MLHPIDKGILPTIEKLTASFKDFKNEFFPAIEDLIEDDKIEKITQEFELMLTQLTELPERVNHSYDLLQLVIQSIQSSRNELQKSVDGLLKKTGQQLQKVTSTTEDATNKIMDIAEKLDEAQLDIISLIEKLHEEHLDEKSMDLVDEIKSKIYQNQDAAFTIIDFLQFQDITAQQIAGANSLLADTEKTLIYVSSVLKRFDPTHEVVDASLESGVKVDKNAFNAEAVFTDKKSIQNAIDNLFESGDTETEIPEEKIEIKESNSASSSNAGTGQDDIDALFNQKDEEVDIDALFEENNKKKEDKGKEKEEVSQDDIDSLFS